MSGTSRENWRKTQLTPLSRGFRLFGAVLFLLFVLVLAFNTSSEHSQSYVGAIVYAVLVGASIYDFHFIFCRGLRWNSQEIQQTGTLFPSRTYLWSDLSNFAPNMHKRATILTFKGLQQLKLYWGYEAHREILEFAKGEMSDAGTS